MPPSHATDVVLASAARTKGPEVYLGRPPHFFAMHLPSLARITAERVYPTLDDAVDATNGLDDRSHPRQRWQTNLAW